MQYHAMSLSLMDHVKEVTLIGYEGEGLISELINNDKIKEKR